MTAPTPNAELAYKVLDRIDAHPEQWHQNDWAYKNECGTSYCFAGWAVLLAGRELIWEDLSETYDEAAWVVDDRQADGKQWIGDAAREALGIDESYDLFRGLNTRADLGRLVAEIFGPRLEPDPRCTVCGSLKSQHNQLGLQLHGLIPVEEMQPPPCADHEQSELNCPVCSAQRRAFYTAMGREAVAEIVDHGPVKPPYGTPEREAYDRDHGGAS